MPSFNKLILTNGKSLFSCFGLWQTHCSTSGRMWRVNILTSTTHSCLLIYTPCFLMCVSATLMISMCVTATLMMSHSPRLRAPTLADDDCHRLTQRDKGVITLRLSQATSCFVSNPF